MGFFSAAGPGMWRDPLPSNQPPDATPANDMPRAQGVRAHHEARGASAPCGGAAGRLRRAGIAAAGAAPAARTIHRRGVRDPLHLLTPNSGAQVRETYRRISSAKRIHLNSYLGLGQNSARCTRMLTVPTTRGMPLSLRRFMVSAPEAPPNPRPPPSKILVALFSSLHGVEDLRRVHRAVSLDGGQTWTKPTRTSLPNFRTPVRLERRCTVPGQVARQGSSKQDAQAATALCPHQWQCVLRIQ